MCNTESTSDLDRSADLRVLIAEDETLIRLDLAETLTELGLEVVGAVGNGQLAVDSARALRPDVVLMDVSMPIRDGISAAQEIIGLGIAPVVLLSAFSQNDLVSERCRGGNIWLLGEAFYWSGGTSGVGSRPRSLAPVSELE